MMTVTETAARQSRPPRAARRLQENARLFPVAACLRQVAPIATGLNKITEQSQFHCPSPKKAGLQPVAGQPPPKQPVSFYSINADLNEAFHVIHSVQHL